VRPGLYEPNGEAHLFVDAPVAVAAREEFTGIGVVLGKPGPDGFPEVAGIVDNAGDDVKQAIKKGDRITQVDGQSTVGLTLEDVVKRIRGPEGTTVKLTLKRPGE